MLGEAGRDRLDIPSQGAKVHALSCAPKQATATALPFRDAAFDSSMAVLTIHHWPDWEKGLLELRHHKLPNRHPDLGSPESRILADRLLPGHFEG
jgi:hypothetical protein